MVQFLARKIGPGGTFLDVGSGEGIISLKMAEDLQARRVILTDNTHKPVVVLPSHAEFYFVDVQSEEFVRQFQNQANVVVCQCVLHEVPKPVTAAVNLIRVLPIGGMSLILDYSEEGWAHQRAMAATGDAQCQTHFVEDMVRIKFVGFGFDTDAGIRRFWEEGLFPRVPGECSLSFNGDLYSVLYIPRQWGEVKESPPDIERMLRARY